MSKNEPNIGPHAAWKPHHITAVDTSGQCTGFIGRSVATVLGGVEVVVHARNVDDLATAWGVISNKPLDEERIYKGTLIQSDRVEVEVVETPAEVPVPTTPAEESAYDPNAPLEIDTEAFLRGENASNNAPASDGAVPNLISDGSVATERVGPGQIDFDDPEL